MTTTPKKQSEEPTEHKKGHEEIQTRLTAPVLTFDFAAEIEQLRREEHWLRDGRISRTLVKHSDFRIVLMLMKTGMLMQEHKTDARISIHILSGRLLIKLEEQTVELPAGHLLVLEKALSHEVNALEESAFLLSISWPHGVDQEPQESL
jgi:quercetin dioxygenase-like cupin family protein